MSVRVRPCPSVSAHPTSRRRLITGGQPSLPCCVCVYDFRFSFRNPSTHIRRGHEGGGRRDDDEAEEQEEEEEEKEEEEREGERVKKVNCCALM